MLQVCLILTGLVIWWPYYDAFVTSSSNLPSAVMITQLTCRVGDYQHINGTVLSSTVYFEDVTLASNVTPYFVVEDIFVAEGAKMDIERGVEVVFISDARILVSGSIAADCDSTNATEQVYIHSNLNNQQGQIRLFGKGSGDFCNVLFESLRYGIYIDHDQDQGNSLTVHHCEFGDNYDALYKETKDMYTWQDKQYFITDTLFHGNINAISGLSYASIDDITITQTESYSIHNLYLSDVSNSKIIGKWPGMSSHYACIELDFYQGINIINNTMSNCLYALFGQTNDMNVFADVETKILYNTFANCNDGLKLKWSENAGDASKLIIQYNNWINIAGLNVIMKANVDIGMAYNYWGGDFITDQYMIARDIYDHCDNDTYDGMVQYWPWLAEPFVPINDYPDMYTIDVSTCNETYLAIAYKFMDTDAPTMHPSNHPSTDPTLYPSNQPTTGYPTAAVVNVEFNGSKT